MGGDEAASRRAQRLENAAYHAAAHQRRMAEETARAAVLLGGFARAAVEAGLTSRPLEARAYSGSGRYRTGVVGWYLRRDRSLGVGTDGRYYVLFVPRSVRARLTGAEVSPADPPLVVGAGGRDGESIPLDALLRLRLEAGDDFP